MNSDAWVEAAAPRLTGCPLQTIRFEWQNTVREFFNRSTSWREWLAPVALVDGQNQYTLVPPASTEVVLVHHVRILEEGSLAPSADTPLMRSSATGNRPTQFSQVAENTIEVWPVPNAEADGKELQIKVSLSSTDITYEFTTPLSGQWFDVILDGMLGRLMGHAAKPYMDMQKAAYHLGRFRAGMARARGQAIRGDSHAQNIWEYPQGFANGRDAV